MNSVTNFILIGLHLAVKKVGCRSIATSRSMAHGLVVNVRLIIRRPEFDSPVKSNQKRVGIHTDIQH